MIWKNILLLFLITTSIASAAQDTIYVALNKKTYTQKDTLEADVAITTHFRRTKAQTINVIIENVQTHQQWKYRYPILGNATSFSLAINEKIPDGAYAVNFLLQPDFFSIRGQLDKKKNNDKYINYLMTFKNKESIIDGITINDDGSFRLNNMLFEDSSFIVFSPVKRRVRNTLDITANLTLDSSYTPLASHTEFIIINTAKKIDTLGYSTPIKIVMTKLYLKKLL